MSRCTDQAVLPRRSKYPIFKDSDPNNGLFLGYLDHGPWSGPGRPAVRPRTARTPRPRGASENSTGAILKGTVYMHV